MKRLGLKENHKAFYLFNHSILIIQLKMLLNFETGKYTQNVYALFNSSLYP